MDSSIKTVFGVIAILIIVFTLCSFLDFVGPVLFGAPPGGSQLREGYSDQDIPMVDPSGRNPDNDLQNSETNLNNSQANKNNADALVPKAVATSIIAKSESEYPKPTDWGAMVRSFLTTLAIIIGIFVVGFVALARRA